MELIRPLRTLLDPMTEHLSFILDDEDPLHPGHDRTPRILEGHATLDGGRMLLFGFYQHAARGTIAAEMWVTGGATRVHRASGIGSAARRRQAWSYGPATDAQDLARTIVSEFMFWVQAVGQASEPVLEAPRALA